MKKSVIIGGFLCVLGVLCAGLALSMADWDFGRISTQPQYEEKEVSFVSQGQDIRISDRDKAIYVGPSPDKDIHLRYEENEKNEYRISDSETLDIEWNSKLNWTDYIFNVDFQQPTLTLLLPSDFAGSLTVESSNGKIELDSLDLKSLRLETRNAGLYLNALSVQEGVDLTTSNARIEVRTLTSGKDLQCTTDNARILLEKVNAKSVTLNSKNGSLQGDDLRLDADANFSTRNAAIELSNLVAKGDLHCETDNSPIVLEEIRAKNLTADSKNGRIETEDLQIDEDISLQSSQASISFESMQAGGDITLTNANGKISGSISGRQNAFTIHAKTNNGSSNLPEQSGSGAQRLQVNTSNASIEIDFTEVQPKVSTDEETDSTSETNQTRGEGFEGFKPQA